MQRSRQLPLRSLAVTAVVSLACSCARSGPTATFSGPLTAGPQIGAESRIDEPVFTEQSGEQSQPFIAAGGPGAIVVWRDDTRPGLAVSNHPPTFSLLDANGNRLDTLPTAITPPTPSALTFVPWIPIAVWNGDRALVFWGDGQELRASRITSDGVVLDPGTPEIPGGISVAVGAGSLYPKAAVPFGANFLVFWLDDGSRVARVGRDGSVSPVGGSLIAFPADAASRIVHGAAAVTGGVLVAAWEASQIKFMKIDATGAALSALSSSAGTAVTLQAGIASSGSGGLLCWSESAATTGQPVTIYGRRVDANGAWIDTAPFEVRAAGAAVGTVGAVWNGTGYACYWTDAGTRVRAAFRAVAASGTPVAAAVVGPEALATAPVQTVQLVWTGSRYLAGMARTVNAQVGSEALKDRQDGVLARALGTDFAPVGTDATVLSTQSNQQPNFRAVGTPAAAYVVWQDDRQRGNVDIYDSENADTYAARVTVAAGGLVKTVVPLLTGADSQIKPAVGWDGTQFTVAYDNSTPATLGRYVQHASAAGTAAGSPIGPLKDTHGGGETALIWNGQTFLVASLYNANTALVLFRVSSAGAQIDPQAVIVSPGNRNRAFNLQGVAIGGTFVLAFQVQPSDASGAPTGEDDVQGLVVNADGTLPTMTPTVIANGARTQDVPAVATDGSSAVVVWRDRGGAAGPAIAAARIDASLAILGGGASVITQATSLDALGPPALVWTGREYVTVWPRASAGTLAFAGCVLGPDQRCAQGSETTAPGDISASPPDAGAPGGAGATDDVRAPVLTWTDAGGILFYQRLDTSRNVNRQRVFLRSVLVGGGSATDGGADASPFDGGAGGAAGAATAGVGGSSRGGASGSSAGGGAGGFAGGGGPAGGGAGSGGVVTGGSGGGAGSNGGGSGIGGSSSGGGTAGPPGGGCGCALAQTPQSPRSPMLQLAALVLIGLRRRRR